MSCQMKVTLEKSEESFQGYKNVDVAVCNDALQQILFCETYVMLVTFLGRQVGMS